MINWLQNNYQWLFSGIGAALILPLIAIAWRNRQKFWNGLSTYVLKHSKNAGENILFCGYAVSEKNGQEDLILVQDMAGIPYIKTTFVPNTAAIENSLYEAISELVKKAELGIDDILEQGVLPISYIKPYRIDWRKQSTTSRPCIFFKLRIDNLSNLSVNNHQYKIKPKRPVAQAWRFHKFRFVNEYDPNNRIEDDPYRIVVDDYITHEYGRVFLNCVDALVFTKIEGEIKFLMIQREPDGKWEYQKGGLHYHETPKEGAYRVVDEEAGIDSDLVICEYLGFQTPDVSDRGMFYDTLRVHGFTLFYNGNPQKIKLNPSHKTFKWKTIEEAREDVKFLDKRGEGGYGSIFFARWQALENELKKKTGLN